MHVFNKEALLTPVMIQTIDTMVRRFVSEPFINSDVSIELVEWDVVFGTFVDEEHSLNPWQSRVSEWTTDPQYYEAYMRDFAHQLEDYEIEDMRPVETFAVRIIASRRYPTWADHEVVSHKRNLEVTHIPFSVARVNQIKSREKRLIELKAPAIILQNEARRKSFAEYMTMTLTVCNREYLSTDFHTAKPSRNYLRYRRAPITINNNEQFRKCHTNSLGA